MHSIQQSRIGSNYQLKFALNEILDFLFSKDLIEANIDKPVEGSQKSIDIEILTKAYVLRTYEVKTGQVFKASIDKFFDVVESFLHIRRTDPTSVIRSFHIVLSPELPPESIEFWSEVAQISEYRPRKLNQNGRTAKQEAEFLYDNSGSLKSKSSLVDFVDLIRVLKIIQGPSYAKNNEWDMESDLEDLLVARINDFCNRFPHASELPEVPTKYIVCHLLEAIQKSVEQDLELSRPIIECLLHGISRRRLIRTYAEYNDGRDKMILLGEEEANTTREIQNTLGLSISSEERVISSATDEEGAQI